jgi:hypothetical protein
LTALVQAATDESSEALREFASNQTACRWAHVPPLGFMRIMKPGFIMRH